MAHLVKAFKNRHRQQVVLIKEARYQKEKDSIIKLWAKYIWLCSNVLKLLLQVKQKDQIFFTEYGGIGWQTKIASILNLIKPRVGLIGLVHLPLSILTDYYQTEDKLKKVLNLVNSLIVFGSSLEKDLLSLNIKPKVVRSFHYVDPYYLNEDKAQLERDGKLRVLFMGNLMRNYKLLISLIGSLDPQTFTFDVCLGNHNLKEIFQQFKNVNVYGYLRENELLQIMKDADISLNILEDTIGSNVITTSLACALPLVTSDVGSIRDYADESCALFCKNDTESFIAAAKHLQEDSFVVRTMSRQALVKAKSFLLDESLNFFDNFFHLN
ncbi:hypothetical protein SAE01_01020 [Segetibacter aerophilus]|uniref:Glycosyl transferase family 1 domain-containing protein n=2 Tax=Segetibacter aerophilus TaxID=670293 RepID=A0A512B6L6_9BACT|nr:hypothetical protein SAE01_01020 [Segetibacter aerophilus]